MGAADSESAESVVVLGTGLALAGRETVWVVVCTESGLEALSVVVAAPDALLEIAVGLGSWTVVDAAFGLGSYAATETEVGLEIWTGTDSELVLGSWLGAGLEAEATVVAGVETVV